MDFANDIFDDKEMLMKVWTDERRRRDFQATLMWENIKNFSAIIASLITVDSIILAALSGGKIYLPILLPFVPMIIVFISAAGKYELTRRWVLVLEGNSHLFKLEQLLGLDHKISNRLTYFKDDEYLFQNWLKPDPKSMLNSMLNKELKPTMEYKSTEQFLEDNVRPRTPNMYSYLVWVYFGFIIVAAILIVVHLSLICFRAGICVIH